MKPLALILLLAGLLAASQSLARDPHHHHHAGALDDIVLNDGEKWASDEHLRRGMEGIREAFVAIHDRVRDGEADNDDFQSLATAINENVEYMFANCHLDTEPDTQLHIILANLIQAADILQNAEQHRPGVHRVHQSLDAYGDTFEHDDWEPVAHCH